MKKEFAKYTLFNIMAMLSVSVYILADTLFIANGIGAHALAALNFAIPIFGITSGFGLMLGIGGATKYAILKSQNEMVKAQQVFSNTALITFAVSAAFFISGLFFADNVATIMGTGEEVFEMTRTYLQVILMFAPLFMVNHLLTCFIRNDGFPMLAMLGMISSSFSNIALDYLFIIVLEMGMFGAALATGVGSIIGFCVLMTFFVRKKNSFYLTAITKCKLSAKVVKDVFSTGFPSLLGESSFGFIMIAFNIIIFDLKGSMGVAAFGIIANIALVVISVHVGIGQGTQPLISKYHGLNNTENIKLIMRYATTLSLTISVVVYATMFLGAHSVASLFNNEQNPLLQEIAVEGMRIYFVGSIFTGLNIIMSFYFTSREKLRPAHITSVLRGFMVIIPLAFLLSSAMGMVGVWAALPLAEIVVFGICIYFYLKPLSIF